MRPLSDETPKPLLPLLDIPLLGLAADRLARAGADRIWVNCHQRPEEFEAALATIGPAVGCDLALSHEPEMPLGPGGALKKLEDVLDETFVLANSDAVTDFDVKRLVRAHQSGGAGATLLSIPVDSAPDFSAEEGWAVEYLDRWTTAGPGYRYCGVGVFEPEVLRYLPRGPSGLANPVFTGLLGDGRGLALVECDSYFRDVGTPHDFLLVNLDALAEGLSIREPHSRFIGGYERWDGDVYVGAGGNVEGVDLRHSVVGRQASIPSGTRLNRCVVLPGVSTDDSDRQDSVISRENSLELSFR